MSPHAPDNLRRQSHLQLFSYGYFLNNLYYLNPIQPKWEQIWNFFFPIFMYFFMQILPRLSISSFWHTLLSLACLYIMQGMKWSGYFSPCSTSLVSIMLWMEFTWLKLGMLVNHLSEWRQWTIKTTLLIEKLMFVKCKAL